MSVPESAARSLPSLREGDEDEADKTTTQLATRSKALPGTRCRRAARAATTTGLHRLRQVPSNQAERHERRRSSADGGDEGDVSVA